MPMIQPINGGALIDAFRAGRSDRWATEDRNRQIAAAEAEAERRRQTGELVRQLFGGEQPQGVQAQFAPNVPRAASDGVAGPEAMMPPGTAPAEPPMQAPPRRPNPQVLMQLIAIDPEMGGQIASALKTATEQQIAQEEAKNAHMGATAHWLRQFPVQERAQRLMQAAPILLQQGFTEQQLQQAASDLSDQSLAMYEAHALDYDNLIDNELAEREFRAGKTVPVTGGGNVALVRPRLDQQGNVVGSDAEWIVGGSGGQDIPAEAIAELRQNPGTAAQFDEVFGAGAAARILGGPTGSAPSGGFPR